MAFNVFVTRPIPSGALDILRPHCGVLDVGPSGPSVPRDTILSGVAGRDGVICTVSERIDDEVLEAAGPQCRVFANFGVGTDNVDLQAAERAGVVVTNTPDVLTDATADLTWALMLAAARRVTEGERLIRAGAWQGWEPNQLLGVDVAGATLGVVGAGRIGAAVARRATGFDMRLLYVDRIDRPELEAIGARRVRLTECLEGSDFVTLHTPLTPETRHLIGHAELARMKPSAILVNTSRGPVVDEQALIEVLAERRIAAAGLDVYENEPEVPKELRTLKNVVCLPHLGSATQRTRLRMGQIAAENLLAVLSGREPPNRVLPARG